MTGMTTAQGIGRRIRATRKHRGFATAKQLADAIPGERISESVLQNIEAGRKSDLSVSQLLNIAMGLRVSPLILLAPLGRPDSPLDLPNLSEAFAKMSVAEFDAWASNSEFGPYVATAAEHAERQQHRAARELVALTRERARISFDLLPAQLSPEQEALRERFDTTDQRLAEYTRRINELEHYLIGTDWFASTPDDAESPEDRVI